MQCRLNYVHLVAFCDIRKTTTTNKKVSQQTTNESEKHLCSELFAQCEEERVCVCAFHNMSFVLKLDKPFFQAFKETA